MIKVCHFTSTHKTDDQRIFYKECMSLMKSGYDVSIVGQGASKECNGIKIFGTGETKKSAVYRLIIRPYKVYKLARKIDADIYQFHDMELMPYGNRLRRQGKIVIFDYHEDFASRFADSDVFHLPKLLMKLAAKLYSSYEKKSVSKYAAMISVTPHICRRLSNYNHQTVMIANYPITHDNVWAAETDYNFQSNYICFAGQISDYYCLSTALQAIQSIPDIKFKLCGAQRRGDEIQHLSDLDKSRKMQYLGLLPFNEVPKVISSSRMALVTYKYTRDSNGKEGTLGNNKLFETMLRGVPVVCTNYTLWKDIINKYRCGICVEPDNFNETYAAIKYIIEHPEEAAQMGQRGRNAVLEKYNWGTQESVLLNLYESLTNAKGIK